MKVKCGCCGAVLEPYNKIYVKDLKGQLFECPNSDVGNNCEVSFIHRKNKKITDYNFITVIDGFSFEIYSNSVSDGSYNKIQTNILKNTGLVFESDQYVPFKSRIKFLKKIVRMQVFL
jgi:hypothetical protein